MNRINYQKELEKILSGIESDRKRAQETGRIYRPASLMLHSCCAPCSSYVLEYLASYFAVTVFYYNPNISSSAEYRKRAEEQKRLIAAYNEEGRGDFEGVKNPIRILEGDYRPEEFYRAVEGFEDCPEGGERCFRCYELRLRETARAAREQGADYFGTTLTVSPLKNAEKLNRIGGEIAEEGKCGACSDKPLLWLPSDFKKKGGYQRSVELSARYGLYRQNFCGCSFSVTVQPDRKEVSNPDRRNMTD